MHLYHEFEEKRSKGDFSILPELHSMLSGMKVLLSCSHKPSLAGCRH